MASDLLDLDLDLVVGGHHTGQPIGGSGEAADRLSPVS